MRFFDKYKKKYWKLFLIAIAFLTFEALADLMQPTIMSKIVDKGVEEGDLHYVLKMGAVMLLVTALGAAAAVIRNIISNNVAQKFGTELRSDLFKKIQSFSFHIIDKFETSSLVTRLTNDVTQIQNFAFGMMRIFAKAPLLAVGSIVMAILLNPQMALILVLVVPVVGVLIFLNAKIGFPFFKKVQKMIDKINGVVGGYLSGIRVVKAFNRFDYETAKFNTVNMEMAQVATTAFRVMTIFTPGITLIVNFGILLVLWFGGIKVNSGQMHVGQVIAFINYMTQILASLMMISFVFTSFVRAKASVERIGEVMSQETGVVLPKNVHIPDGKNSSVEFKDVNFSYTGASGEPVLRDLSFTAAPGEIIGIIGSTGSGKSSLINLIPGFYDVTRGYVKIGGTNVRDFDLKKLRESVAIVPQKTVLFTGTIISNIKWGKENAERKEIELAARIAQAHDFISAFPEGYNTILGQGGVNLSGGQKQRISIARALVRKPDILIMDDSTSAVDVATEAKIREGMKEYLKNMTCFIIGQRITSVMNTSKILVLDNGNLVGVGSHEELMKECEVYFDIFRSQIGKEGI